MRVAVTGASGNVGLTTLAHLAGEPTVTSIVGLARRPPAQPAGPLASAEWVSCDIGAPTASRTLREAFAGADVVVHLAWQIQPSHDLEGMRRTNVEGARAVVDAALAAGVEKLVYASSVGTYSPGPKDRAVDESWPTGGIASSAYSRQKAAVESLLDETKAAHPALTVVRLRPGLIFQAAAASEIARYFIGPLLPRSLLRLGVPVVPRIERLRFQAVHADDVGRAYTLAVLRDVEGAFNVAADPVLDPPRLAQLLHARQVPVPAALLRGAVAASWYARLQPTGPGWLDMALETPLMDIARAREVLGWSPRRSAEEALLELLDGLAHGAAGPTPVLSSRRGPGGLRNAVRSRLRAP